MNNFDCIANIRGKCRNMNMKPCRGWTNCNLSKDGRPCRGCTYQEKCDSDFSPCAECTFNRKSE